MMIPSSSRWFTRTVLGLVLFLDVSSARAQEPQGGEIPLPAGPTVEHQGSSDGASEATIPEDEASRAATQVASFAVTKLKDSPAIITVISGEDIRAVGARDLVDILYLVPGYFMGVDTEGMVGIGFRGLWAQEGKILLMIDGKEMNELLFSTPQLGNEFPVELIERVEVVRGPGSVIYGGSAELSVINVVTRGLQGTTDLTAHATYGQMTGAHDLSTGYSRRKITISGRKVFDDIPGLSSYASLSFGQGQRSVRDFVDNKGSLPRTMEGASALDPTLIQAGIGFRNVQASFLYHRLDTTNISGIGLTLSRPEQVTFDAYDGEIIGSFHPTNSIEIVPRFNLTYQRPWYAPDTTTTFFYEKSVRRTRGRLLGRWAALDQLQVTVGGDAIFDYAKLLYPVADPVMGGPGQQTQFNLANDISYQTFGGYAELYSENPVVNVAAGARYDHQSSIGGALVPRLVLLRSFGPVNLKGLFSLSFRAPGIENINLGTNVRPERTRIFEFEAAVDLPFQQRFSANVYDVAIQSPISYTVDAVTGNEGYLNLGRQGTRGFELTYALRSRLARVEANYSFYGPSASENVPAYVVAGHSNQFLGAPAHRASARATFSVRDWFGISPSVLFLGARYSRGDLNPAGVQVANEIPAQLLANLFVFKDNLGIPGLSVGLGIYNIFGVNYRYIHTSTSAVDYVDDHAPLPGLDREIMLRVGYLFEPRSPP